jgi:hypothetical protein
MFLNIIFLLKILYKSCPPESCLNLTWHTSIFHESFNTVSSLNDGMKDKIFLVSAGRSTKYRCSANWKNFGSQWSKQRLQLSFFVHLSEFSVVSSTFSDRNLPLRGCAGEKVGVNKEAQWRHFWRKILYLSTIISQQEAKCLLRNRKSTSWSGNEKILCRVHRRSPSFSLGFSSTIPTHYMVLKIRLNEKQSSTIFNPHQMLLECLNQGE